MIKIPEIIVPVNEHGWALLFQAFGHSKLKIRACKIKDRGRIMDEDSQHRMSEFETEGGTKVRSKVYNTSDFFREKE